MLVQKGHKKEYSVSIQSTASSYSLHKVLTLCISNLSSACSRVNPNCQQRKIGHSGSHRLQTEPVLLKHDFIVAPACYRSQITPRFCSFTKEILKTTTLRDATSATTMGSRVVYLIHIVKFSELIHIQLNLVIDWILIIKLIRCGHRQ